MNCWSAAHWDTPLTRFWLICTLIATGCMQQDAKGVETREGSPLQFIATYCRIVCFPNVTENFQSSMERGTKYKMRARTDASATSMPWELHSTMQISLIMCNRWYAKPRIARRILGERNGSLNHSMLCYARNHFFCQVKSIQIIHARRHANRPGRHAQKKKIEKKTNNGPKGKWFF